MNIPPTIHAVESLDEAIELTINPEERRQLMQAQSILTTYLRGRGVFIGTQDHDKRTADRIDGYDRDDIGESPDF